MRKEGGIDAVSDSRNAGEPLINETGSIYERDQKLTSRIEPIQEHCDRTKIKKGFA